MKERRRRVGIGKKGNGEGFGIKYKIVGFRL
jgi:hypothetical protein